MQRSTNLLPIGLLALLSVAGPTSIASADSASPHLAETMPTIVKRSIAYHGGDLFSRSDTRFQLCSKSGCATVGVQRDGGLYEHRVEARFGDEMRRLRATNDTVQAWRLSDGDDALETISIEPAAEQRWRDLVTARVYHAFLPFRLADPSVRFADLGEETWGDRTLHRVAVGFEAGTSSADYDQWAFWFDPKTARLEQFAYSYSGNPDGLRFRRLHNFRRVEGLLFADQENRGWEGPGLTVAELGPTTVQRLRHVSDVALRDVEVTLLPGRP